MHRFLVCLVFAGFSICQDGAGTPRFRSDVNLVNLTFTVRDPQGALSAHLGKEDFEVFEDGQAQSIRFFYRSTDQPLTLGLVLDASGSQKKFIKKQKRHIERFLKDVLGPKDRAFIVSFANTVRVVSDYSSSLNQLLERLDAYSDASGKELLQFPELGPRELRIAGTAYFDAIYYSIRDMLAREDGRKALVVFSDGEDNSSARHMLDVIEAAQAADVPLYALRYTEIKEDRPNSRNKYGASVIARISRETGGRDFDASEEPIERSFRAIGEELRSHYEIGYATTNPLRDGAFRKVQIRCRREGYTILTKTGYYAAVPADAAGNR